MTRRLKSMWSATGVSFLSFSKALCVCQSRFMFCLIYCCLSCYKSSNIKISRMYKARQRQRNIRAKADHVTDCVFLPANTTSNETGIPTIWAWSDWEWSMHSRLSMGPTARIVSGFHCVCFACGIPSLRREYSSSVPRGTGSASGKAERWLCSWESQMDPMEGMKMGEPLSSSFPIRFSAYSLRLEARPAVLPPGERARRSVCLLPRRGTWRTSMSFRKA